MDKARKLAAARDVKVDLPELRYLTQAGARMSPELGNQLRATFPGARLFVMYGQTEAAARLGCSTGTIYDWIKTGKLPARRGTGNRLCIRWTQQVEAECRRRVAKSGHLNPAARRTRPRARA